MNFGPFIFNKYLCQVLYSGKSFSRVDSLKKHIHIGSSFTEVGHLNTHINTVHENLVASIRNMW